jgi:putative ABC transport system permease protein
VLLSGAGLLIRSFVNLQTVDLGLDPRGLWHAPVSLPPGQYKTAESRHRMLRDAVGRVRALPGVVAASTATGLPVFGAPNSEVEVAGRTHRERWDTQVHLVGEGHDAAVGLRLRQGRFLSEQDIEQARKVAVVNQTFVRRYFGAEAPLGRTIELTRLATLNDFPVPSPVFEVVGVTADVKNQGVQEAVVPEVYAPYTITGSFNRAIVVRVSSPAAPMADVLKREIWAVDRALALTQVASLADLLRQYAYAGPRLVLVILAVFAGLGLTLVTLGVFSVIAYAVSRQTRDIGVRMALGARRPDVLAMVLGQALKLVGIGVAVGTAASLALTRVLSSELVGVSPYDPLTLAAVVAVVVAAGLAASYIPALRATRVDPMVALRYD